MEISTSILSVKEENSVKTFYDLESSKTDYFHIDVMDGKFVKNDTSKIMLEYIENIRQISNLPIDVHLMVEDVEKYINEYIIFNPSFITIHYEAIKDKNDIYKIINKIKENGIKCGLAIKPDTKIEEVYEYLPYIHLLLIMTVNPGEGGQKLIPETIEKIKMAKQILTEKNIDIYIEADGGINTETVGKIQEAGVDIAVVGSAILNSENYAETIKRLKQ